MIEECASGDLYSNLKRPDEKYVTEKAYGNPMFFEDVAKEMAKHLLWNLRTSSLFIITALMPIVERGTDNQ